MKLVWKVVKAFLVGIAVLVGLYVILLIGSIVISSITREKDSKQQTDEYLDYVALPPNITYVEYEKDLEKHAFIEDKLNKFEYYQIKGLDETEFIGAKYIKIGIYGTNDEFLVLANRNKNFSVWRDWDVKEIRLFNTKSTDDTEVIKSFTYFVSAIDNSAQGVPLYDTDGASCTKTTYQDIYALFEQSDYVEWRGDVEVKEYSNGKVKVFVNVYCFDPYPEIIQSRYFEVEPDSPLYNFILESIENTN